MEKIWRPIPDLEETHAVSNYGEVMSLCPRRGGRKGTSRLPGKDPYIMKPSVCRKNYLCLRLGTSSERKNWKIHRLVAIAFVPNPMNKPQVNHIDGNKHNNRADNLEWVTNAENCAHTYAAGITIRARGEKSPFAKLSDEDIQKIRDDNRVHHKIAKDWGVTRGWISHIKAGKART